MDNGGRLFRTHEVNESIEEEKRLARFLVFRSNFNGCSKNVDDFMVYVESIRRNFCSVGVVFGNMDIPERSIDKFTEFLLCEENYERISYFCKIYQRF